MSLFLYRARWVGVAAFSLLVMPFATSALDAGGIANKICERERYQYDCQAPNVQNINGRRVVCWNSYPCQGSDAGNNFRVRGSCRWKAVENRGACFAEYYAGDDGKWHPLHVSSDGTGGSLLRSVSPDLAQTEPLSAPVAGGSVSPFSFCTGDCGSAMLSAFNDPSPASQAWQNLDWQGAYSSGDSASALQQYAGQYPTSAGRFAPSMPISVPPSDTGSAANFGNAGQYAPTYGGGTPAPISTAGNMGAPATGFTGAPPPAPETSWYQRVWNSMTYENFSNVTDSIQDMFRCRSSFC